MYDNYLFDLYGTLVDIHTEEWDPVLWKKLSYYMHTNGASYQPEKLHERYLQLVSEAEAVAAAALPEPKNALSMAEIDLAETFSALYLEKGVRASDTLIASTALFFRIASLRKLRLFDGVIELLSALQSAGKKIYLLSNAQSLFTRPELAILGLPSYFDGIVLSSEAGRKKPDPAFYEALLTTYELDPARTVMVGNDDLADCHGAAAAGLDSMYICTEQSPEQARPLPGNCRHLQSIREVFD